MVIPPPPKLDGLRRRERAKLMVEYQTDHEMPIGLRMILLVEGKTTYTEPQIRQFARMLSATKYNGKSYREMWEIHAHMDDYWVTYRSEFGEDAVNRAIDHAVDRQDLREAGEIE